LHDDVAQAVNGLPEMVNGLTRKSKR